MEKKILLIVFLFFSFSIFAKEITPEEASSAAFKLLTSYSQNYNGKVCSVEAVQMSGTTVYFIVGFQPEGWALISADDRAAPFIAYSDTGTYIKIGQPETIRLWLNDYGKQILDASKAKDRTRHHDWDLANISTKSSSTTIVDPLITVNWNQSSPYNQFCPSDKDGQALVGCVAVAMAQAMSVAKYPERPIGKYSYFNNIYGTIYLDYDKEASYDWDIILSGSDKKVAVARLLYHCGVSLKMNYASSSSGAYTDDIPYALKTYFSYSSSVVCYSRSSYQDDKWTTLIKDELKAGRAVIYSGDDGTGAEGHCFNLDGFSGSAFHINWGWGGQNNGYYAINGLIDGSSDYRKNQQIVIGIQPKESTAINDVKNSNFVFYNKETKIISIKTDKEGQYKLFTLHGQIISVGTLNEGVTDLSVRNLSNGCYIIQIIINAKPRSQKLIIK